MISLNLAKSVGELQVLCLGCHSDDLEIGCGGAILRLAKDHPRCTFHWVVFSATGDRATEAQRAAQELVTPEQLKGPMLLTFPDGCMPFVAADIKATFEQLKRTLSPDLILTHNRKDAHQDHRLIADLTWSTFRDHLILEYEIPKYDGDLGRPSVFVPLPLEICERKVRVIMDNFCSQSTKRWFDRETFLGLMRLRGMECNAPSGYAEAFYGRKLVL